MTNKIIKWLYSFPDPDQLFGCNIRETIQNILPCKHNWLESAYDVRCCTKCWKKQRKIYYRFGNIRTQWIDIPMNAHKLFRCKKGR